jgi:hypothetical protein
MRGRASSGPTVVVDLGAVADRKERKNQLGFRLLLVAIIVVTVWGVYREYLLGGPCFVPFASAILATGVVLVPVMAWITSGFKVIKTLSLDSRGVGLTLASGERLERDWSDPNLRLFFGFFGGLWTGSSPVWRPTVVSPRGWDLQCELSDAQFNSVCGMAPSCGLLVTWPKYGGIVGRLGLVIIHPEGTPPFRTGGAETLNRHQPEWVLVPGARLEPGRGIPSP